MAISKPEIAFIGLGAMGFGMATNLVKQGYPVTGFDVWAPTLEKFKAQGGRTAETPAESVKDKQYCVCMVATAQQVQSILIDGPNAAVTALAKGAVVLVCSTVPSSYIQSLAKQLAALGRDDIHLVDCPVSGGAYRAADGTLSIMAGGTDAAIESSKFLLQEMSDAKKLYIVSGGIGAGSNMKMVHQVLAAIQILAASEALGFATHLGLDLQITAQRVVNSLGRSWMFEHRYPRILHPQFQPLVSALTIILKDTSIITGEARNEGFPTLMTSVAEQVYFTGLGRGYGPDDDSSLIRLYSEGKGKVGPVAGTTVDDEAKISLIISLLKGIHLCAAGETIAFASRLGLDLDQVLDLCRNAAGGSNMLDAFGQSIVDLARGKDTPAGDSSLASLAIELKDAVDEAQRLKVPVHLGGQALNILRSALTYRGDAAAQAPFNAVLRVWYP